MKRLQISTAIFATLLGVAFFVPNAAADEVNQKMIVTFTEPIEIPGAVTLQPGSYVFKLQDSRSDRHIVLIQNDRENHTFAQVFATDAHKVRPSGHLQFSFWESPAGQPRVLRAMFWPGRDYGQEFMYKKERADQLSTIQSQRESIPTTPDEPPPSQ